jgi:low temperature requirement protein LtrA
VTFVELFFDVVFVFAVTQLSHWLCDIDAARRSSCEQAYIRDT